MTDNPFTAEADIATRATGLRGGILRCEECGGERPADDIAGYLRDGWPRHCGTTMTYVTLKLLAAEGREVPEGFELVAVPDADWRLEPGRPCVRMTKARRSCREPSVAAFNRKHVRTYGYGEPSRTVDSWWPRCLGHMDGNWIENGQVWHWVLREKSADVPH